MYEALEKEIATLRKAHAKIRGAHKRALQRIPLGVASNYRHYEPYPIFVKDGKGSKIHDVDGNEYIDHNLCFGALMAGHCHPAVVKAVEQKLHEGTTFGMPHEQEWELAEEICKRYPVEMVRFGSSGTEVTMHACRIARAATNRDKIIKFEGAYHGLHDTALVSVKPKAEEYGDPDAPNSVPGGGGVPKASLANVVVAASTIFRSVERRFSENPGQIAAIILEPILMNVGLCMPQPGFLQGLARSLPQKRRAADLRRSENRRETRLGRRQRIFRREAGHDLPGEIDRRRSAARRIWRKPRGDGSDLATQSLSRRHVQHESRGHGRRPRHVSRSAVARKLRARRQAQQETYRRLSRNRRESRSAGIRRQRRSQRRADALPAGNSETIATGRTSTSISGATTGSRWSTAACSLSRIGGTSSGRSRSSTPKPTSTSISPCSRKSRPPSRKRSKSAAQPHVGAAGH